MQAFLIFSENFEKIRASIRKISVMKQVSRRGGEKRNLRRNNFCAKEDDKKKRRRRNQGQDCGKAVDDSGGGSRLSALISRRRDGAIYPTCYPQS